MPRNQGDDAGLARFSWSPADYQLTRFVILRSLGLLYFVGFLTLVRQWRPLIGSDGLLPAATLLLRVREQLGSLASACWHLPSLFWIDSSDGFRELRLSPR
ncbi:MAG: hypothetical protein ABJB12_18690 [Pseudomonadota bacterium]